MKCEPTRTAKIVDIVAKLVATKGAPAPRAIHGVASKRWSGGRTGPASEFHPHKLEILAGYDSVKSGHSGPSWTLARIAQDGVGRVRRVRMG
jgi:hypothetical protein